MKVIKSKFQFRESQQMDFFYIVDLSHNCFTPNPPTLSVTSLMGFKSKEKSYDFTVTIGPKMGKLTSLEQKMSNFCSLPSPNRTLQLHRLTGYTTLYLCQVMKKDSKIAQH